MWSSVADEVQYGKISDSRISRAKCIVFESFLETEVLRKLLFLKKN